MQEKKFYTKDEIVQNLGVQPYIMALWEKQFGIETAINDGQAHYSSDDLAKLRSVKELLYEKGFTIDAAKKYLHENPLLQASSVFAASPLLFESKKNPLPLQSSLFYEQVIALRKQLLVLKAKL
jgi:DNA-binding transcriptional MerR regulator